LIFETFIRSEAAVVTGGHGSAESAAMIMTYLNILATLMLLAQPVQERPDAGPVSDAVVWSADASPTAAPISAETSKPVRRAAKPLATHLLPKPRPKGANAQPAANVLVGSAHDTTHSRTDGAAADAGKPPQVMVARTPAEQRTAALTVPAPGGDTKTAPAPSKDTDRLVAIMLASPDIKSVSDLSNKTVAIDAADAAASGDVRTAIVAAGAANVQISGSQTNVVDRLISGEVPAVVLTLEAPEAAQTFPEVPGFRMFRVPLSPASLNGPPNAK
jgi:ABC-type phosphate/phosphonate transport system substrate-binding protein